MAKKIISSDFLKGEQTIIKFSAIFFYDTWEELGLIGLFFSICNRFPSISSGHPQSKITNTSFCALVEYLLTGLQACVFENCRRYLGPESYFSKI